MFGVLPVLEEAHFEVFEECQTLKANNNALGLFKIFDEDLLLMLALRYEDGNGATYDYRFSDFLAIIKE